MISTDPVVGEIEYLLSFHKSIKWGLKTFVKKIGTTVLSIINFSIVRESLSFYEAGYFYEYSQLKATQAKEANLYNRY